MRPKRKLRAAAYREASGTSQRGGARQVLQASAAAIYLAFTMRNPLSSSSNHATWFPQRFQFYPLF
jgi:hypothetical protein